MSLDGTESVLNPFTEDRKCPENWSLLETLQPTKVGFKPETSDHLSSILLPLVHRPVSLTAQNKHLSVWLNQ